MCTLPFNTPSVEPNGDVRLCSAASTFAYQAETMMGNINADGLAAVWTNARFQEIRQSLLTGEDVKPYCRACEYCHEGPPWMLQLHLALIGFHETGSAEFVAIIEQHLSRFEEYLQLAPSVGLSPLALPPQFHKPIWHRYVPARVRPLVALLLAPVPDRLKNKAKSYLKKLGA
jgi:radical SAM protein with 4Fe4S-binding SPASM domain